MANSCPKATSFFGVLQYIYIFYFLLLPKRWKILQDHVHNLTLESLSQPRWESRVKSVKVVRFQALQTRDALFKLVVETSDDHKIKSDCLTTYEIENLNFC